MNVCRYTYFLDSTLRRTWCFCSRQHIPELALPELRSLDVSSNELTSVDFLKFLPSLTELRLSPGNADLGEQSLFLTVFYCKKLTRINGEAADKYKASLKTLRKSLLQIVTEVWKRTMFCYGSCHFQNEKLSAFLLGRNHWIGYRIKSGMAYWSRHPISIWCRNLKSFVLSLSVPWMGLVVRVAF